MEEHEGAVAETKGLWKWITSSAFIAGLCCLPSVLLAGFGLMSLSAADALSKQLYFGPFRPFLYLLTLGFLSYGLVHHFRSKGICTLDEAQRQRTRIVNTTLLVLLISFCIFWVWDYIIIQMLGIAIGLPWQEDAVWNF